MIQVFSAYAFSAFTLLVGQQEGHPVWKNWLVVCWRGYLVASVKSRLVLPSWYRLAQIFLDKGPLNGCCSCCLGMWNACSCCLGMWNACSCCLGMWNACAAVRRSTRCQSGCRMRGRSPVPTLSSCSSVTNATWTSSAKSRSSKPADLHRNTVLLAHALSVCCLSVLLPQQTQSPTHSFIPGLNPSFSANPSHRSLSFSSPGLTAWIPRGLFTDTFDHIRFFSFLFSF